jgi:hypothetical protein
MTRYVENLRTGMRHAASSVELKPWQPLNSARTECGRTLEGITGHTDPRLINCKKCRLCLRLNGLWLLK